MLIVLFGIVRAISPARYLNLPETFALQIPTPGSITTVKFPALRDYESQYWKVGKDGVEVFAPQNGGETDNGSGPRTQLAEQGKPFKFQGYHSMRFTQAVLEANPTGNVCIGQVKGLSYHGNQLQASCLIVVEYIYSIGSGQVSAHFRDKNCNSVDISLGKYAVGQKIATQFIVNGYSVTVKSSKKTLPAYDYSFWKGRNYEMQFKVGAYDQGDGSSSSKGGRTILSEVVVTHTGMQQQ